MSMREGMIPTALGTAVTAAAVTLIATKHMPKVATGVLGFGLAHMVLGSIDLVEHKPKRVFHKGWM